MSGALDVVVSCGKNNAACTLLSEHLSRSQQSVGSLSEAAELIGATGVNSALVVLRAAETRHDDIIALNHSARVTGTLVGVFVSDAFDDAPTAVDRFLAARRGPLTGRSGFVDAVFGRLAPGAARGSADGSALSGELGSSFDDLTIVAHGDGAHLLIGDTVLCGLVGDEERISGSPLPNGCSGATCKRARHRGLARLGAECVEARVVLVMSCCGFSFGHDLYPSTNSLVGALVRGGTAAVIAAASTIDLDSEEMIGASALLAGSLSMGRLVQLLNATYADRSGCAPFVLHGDPLWCLRSADDRPPWISSTARPAAVIDVIAEPADAMTGWLGAGQEVAVAARSAACAPVVARSEMLERMVAFSRSVLTRVIDCSALQCALRSECWSALAVRPDGRRALKDLEQACTQLEHAARHLARECVLVTKTGRWNERLVSARAQVARHIELWDRCFVALSARHALGISAIGESLFSALHCFMLESVVPSGATCTRCRNRLFIRHYQSIDGGTSREGTACGVCGPCSERAVNGLGVAVDFVGWGRDRQRGRLSVTVAPSSTPLTENVRIAYEVRDPTFAGSLATATIDLPSTARAVDIPVALPPDAGFDLFAARVIAVAGLEIAMARVLFTRCP
jgi:hypothetical protein